MKVKAHNNESAIVDYDGVLYLVVFKGGAGSHSAVKISDSMAQNIMARGGFTDEVTDSITNKLEKLFTSTKK